MADFPNFPAKHAHDAAITPDAYLEYLKTIKKYPTCPAPQSVILCYQSSLFEHILATHSSSLVGGYFKALHLLDETGGRVGVMGHFGIGSPAAVIALEELIAFGVKSFVSIGTAGALQPDLNIGDLIVCERAIRDEGSSHHYLPRAKYAHASRVMTERLANSLSKTNQVFKLGTSWTIDTPYRETIAEVRFYQEQGVATVEMEAAALFAVAECRGVELGAMLTISDSLAELPWKPAFHHPRTREGLEALYKVALDALT